MPETAILNGSDKKLDLNKIYELNYKIGPTLKSVKFEASSDLDAKEKGDKFVNFINGLTTAKCVLIGNPKKFAIDIDDEITRLKKLVDQGRSPFH